MMFFASVARYSCATGWTFPGPLLSSLIFQQQIPKQGRQGFTSCLSFPLRHSYGQRHQLLQHDVPRLRVMYLHHREGSWGRGFPETPRGEAAAL